MTSQLANKAILFLAYGFGSGLASKTMPGTMGTLAAVPLYLLLRLFPLPVYLAVTLAGTLLGVWICGKAAKHLGKHDHPSIVFDEILGFLWAMAFAPPGWLWLALGFGLFRLFDILKPWPIRTIDRQVTGGLGIMLDDVLAGFYVNLLWMIVSS